MFNKGQLAGFMKKAQEMQKKLAKAQEELANLEVSGESGGGVVTVVMTGKRDLKKVTIDPLLLTDKEMLEDLIVAAVNNANQKIEESSLDKMGNLSADMLPPEGLEGLLG